MGRTVAKADCERRIVIKTETNNGRHHIGRHTNIHESFGSMWTPRDREATLPLYPCSRPLPYAGRTAGSLSIGVTETCLNTGMTDPDVLLTIMSLIRNDWLKKAGGVILYYQSRLQCGAVDNAGLPFSDSLWSRLQLHGRCVWLIALVYRLPNSSPEMDCQLAAGLRCMLKRKYAHTLFVRDFIVHFLGTASTNGENFKPDHLELITSVAFCKHVIMPTGFSTDNRPSLLDLVFSNEELWLTYWLSTAILS